MLQFLISNVMLPAEEEECVQSRYVPHLDQSGRKSYSHSGIEAKADPVKLPTTPGKPKPEPI